MNLRVLFGGLLFSGLISIGAQAGLPTFDDEFSCTDAATANRYLGDLSVDTNSFGGMELCNPRVDTKKLLNDVTIIEQGKFEGDGSNPLIRGAVPINDYYGWLKSMTYGMDRGNDVPWATAYNRGGYFTMQDGWSKLSTLGRIGTVIHEARHTAGYGHIPCTTGPYSNTNLPGCDRDFSYGGSHGIEMEYYARVAIYGTNFHPIYKKMARLMAMGRSNFVFNTKPLSTREALLVVDQQKRVILIDGSKQLLRDGNVAARRLKRTSFGATLFDFTRAFAIDPYAMTNTTRDVNDDYSYYKLLMDDRGQGTAPLKDMEELDLGVRRHFVYLNGSGQMAAYSFRDGKWGDAVTAPRGVERFSAVGPKGEPGLFARTPAGEVYQLNPDNLAQQTLLKQSWSTDVVAIVRDANQNLALGNDGRLTDLDTRAPYAPTRNLLIDQAVNIPLYNAFGVNP